MTTDEVLQAAKEAGFGIKHAEAAAILFTRFAALVAAAEREECAQIVETAPDYLVDSTFKGAAKAIRARSKP